MKKRYATHYFLVGFVFLLALVLETLPMPQELQGFRPSWIVIGLLYWILAIPERFSIGSAFVIGLVWDLITGSLLGLHATLLAIFAYLICLNYLTLRSLSLWFQSLLVVLFVFALHLGFFFIEYTLYQASFNYQEIVGALLSGLLWPWLAVMLNKIRFKLGFY